jgi:uncharacterized protein (TIGR03435 family)
MKFLVKVLAVASLPCFAGITSYASAGANGPHIGDAPPPLKLNETLQGPAADKINWDILKGKVVVVEFWSTRCGPCIAAIPHWNQLAEAFADKPVVFLSIADDNEDYLKRFLKSKPLKGWVATDKPQAPAGVTGGAFDVKAIPHTVIVDGSGKIAAITHPTKLEAKHLQEILDGTPCSLPAPKPDVEDDDTVVRVTELPPPTLVEISIRGPFPMPKGGAFNSRGWNKEKGEFTASKAYLRDALASLFEISPKLIFENAKLSGELYDISVMGPPDKFSELKSQFCETFKTAFGLTAKIDSRDIDVYVMTVVSTNAPGLNPSPKSGSGGGRRGGFVLSGSDMKTIADFLEQALDRPVVNTTGLTNLWGVDLRWKMSSAEIASNVPPDPTNVIEAAREQLGLQLTPTKRRMQVLDINPAE